MAIAAIMDPALFVLIVMVIALVFFATGIVPLGATALFVDLALFLSGVIDADTALGDFGKCDDNSRFIYCG